MENIAEKLQKLILSRNQIKNIVQTQSDCLDYDTSVKLVERVIDAFPIQPEERKGLSTLDIIIYVARGAYIFGYMAAVDTLNEAARPVIDALFEESTQ